MTSFDFVIRPVNERDVAFVLATWLRSFRKSNPDMRTTDYYRAQQELAVRLMTGGNVLVATPADDPDLILGWIAANAEMDVVHYVYIRPIYRRMGIARRLVEQITRDETTVTCTHLTAAAAEIKKTHEIHYIPQLLSTL